jgi:hypothetical protein
MRVQGADRLRSRIWPHPVSIMDNASVDDSGRMF